jgi:HK97 family phage major capsid protein
MLKRLRQQLAEAKAKADALNQRAQTENRDLTAEESTEFSALVAQCRTLKSQIADQEALEEIDRNAPAANDGRRVTDIHDRREDEPFRSFAEQLQSVHRAATSRGAEIDPRLRAAALGGNESVDAEGGFLVRPEFAPGIWQRTYQAAEIAPRCFDQPMTASNRLLINAVDEDSRANGSRYGGVQTFWLGEAQQPSNFQVKFRQMELIAKKLLALTYATDEQLADAPAWAAYVDKVVPLELAFVVDDACMNGTGAAEPFGVTSSPALLQVNRTSAGNVVNTDIFEMWKRCWAPSRKNAVWFINQDVEDQLWNLTRGSGTAVELLYKAPGERGNNSNYGVMMGRPVVPIEQAATLGTTGDIVLADFSQYYLARRSNIELATSIHVQFLTDQQAFRWKLRLDGQPAWKKPLTPKNGTNTLSPFVALT